MDVKVFLQTQQGITPQRNFYLDMFDDETIEITKSIQDVRDISKQFADYSKGFLVPASAKNNEAFKFFFKTDLLDGYNQHQEANAIIEFKGVPLISGTIELIGANTYNGKEKSYEIVFYGNLKSISQVMGEDTLPQIDWSAYGHILNASNVVSSWNGTLLSGEIVYPLWDCSSRANGGWLYDSNNNQSNVQNIAAASGAVKVDELKPAIKLSAFIQTIFTNYGLSLTSAWLNNAVVQKMFVQPQKVAGVGNNPTGADYNMLVRSNQTLLLVQGTNNLVTITSEDYDLANSFDLGANNYVAGYTGDHSFTISATMLNNVGASVGVFFYVNGLPTYKGDINYSVNGSPNSSYSFKTTLNSGDTVQLYLQSNYYIEINNIGWEKRTNSNIPKEGNQTEVGWSMPPIKVSEFFAKFLQTFNLILEPSGIDAYTLEPLDDWYAQGTKRYWNNYINQESVNYKKVPIFKNISFSHSLAEIDTVKEFKKVVGRNYGEVLWDSDLEFDPTNPNSTKIDFSDGELSIESPFNVPVSWLMPDNSATTVNTSIETMRFFEEGEPVLSELNIAFFNGVYSCSPFYLDDNGTATQYNYYPNFSFSNYSLWTNAQDSLAYSLEQNVNGGIPVDTLYQVYYNNYLRRLYSKQTRVVVCDAVISLAEFQAFRLNDIIHFQGINYIVNSLVYDFSKQMAKLELISYFVEEVVQNVSSIDPNGQVILELPPSPNDVNLYNSRIDQDELFVNQDGEAVADATHRGQAENTNATVWRGYYQDGAYPANSIVFDSGWLMVSNTDSVEPAAPSTVGAPFYLINDYAPEENSVLATVSSGHKYTLTEGKWLKQIRIYPIDVSANVSHRVNIADITDPDNILYKSVVPENLIANEWNIVAAGNSVYAAGSEFIVWYETVNSSTTTDFSDGWNYGGSSNNAAPPAFGWNKGNQNNIVRFEYQSISADYTSEIQGLISGSTITINESAAPENRFKWLTTALPTDFGTYAEIQVTLVEQLGSIGNGEACEVLFSSPIAGDTLYTENLDYWNTYPPPVDVLVEPLLQFDGEAQDVDANTAFGVDIQVQSGTVSPDWDGIAYTPVFQNSAAGAVVSILNYQRQRHHYIEPTVPIVDNSTTWQTVITDTPSSFAVGSYIMGFNITANHSNINRQGSYRILVDGVVMETWKCEAKDTSDIFLFTPNSILVDKPEGGSFLVELQVMVSHQSLDITIESFRYALNFWE